MCRYGRRICRVFRELAFRIIAGCKAQARRNSVPWLCHSYMPALLLDRSHELQAVGPGAGEFCFADGGRCHPAVRQTGLQQHPLRVQKPSLLAAAVRPSGCRHVVSGGASELASNVRCSSMYACCFTGCGAFARISVLGPTGCLTVLAAARCPGRQHPAGDPAFFCPVVQHLLQLCQCPACWAVPPAVRGRSASPVGEGCPNTQAPKKKRKTHPAWQYR